MRKKPSAVIRHDPDGEVFFREGCHILEWSNSEVDPALSVARARLEAGQTTRWHSLDATVERYVILEGEGRVEVGDASPEMVGPGDVVMIPAGERQRIYNPGPGELVFLALCTPRFRPENYRDLEDGDD